MEAGDFYNNTPQGERLEKAVERDLKDVLPPTLSARRTDQSKGSKDRLNGDLADVIITDQAGNIRYAVECKWAETPYLKCWEHNGWTTDVNVPLNTEAVDWYRRADYPIYILLVNEHSRTILFADIPTLLSSRAGDVYKKDYGFQHIQNYDGSAWRIYKGKISLTNILSDIYKDFNEKCLQLL